MSGEDRFVMQREDVESAILEMLERRGPYSLDELYQALSDYSWNQVFAAVDRLSRNGRLMLCRPGRFDYQVSIGKSGADAPVHPPESR
jgi:hypothetical protein